MRKRPTIDRKHLRELAEAAKQKSSDSWTCSDREEEDDTARVYSPTLGGIARMVVPVAETLPVFGAHIAAWDPGTALAILDRLDELEAKNKGIKP